MTRIAWIAALGLALLAFRTTNSSQPPVGYAGAPFDNGSCRSCHGGGTGTVTISLLANGSPVDGSWSYTPGGSAINMEVRVAHTSASIGGFELTVATPSPANDAAPANSLSAGTGTALLTGGGGRQYLSHSGSKAFSSGVVSWTFTWTPPNTDLGPLRWYIAANAANGNGSTSGDATAATNFNMPVSASTQLSNRLVNKTYYCLVPESQQLLLRHVERAELFSLNGQHFRTFMGHGPHDVGGLAGVYLLRMWPSDTAPLTVRLFIP